MSRHTSVNCYLWCFQVFLVFVDLRNAIKTHFLHLQPRAACYCLHILCGALSCRLPDGHTSLRQLHRHSVIAQFCCRQPSQACPVFPVTWLWRQSVRNTRKKTFVCIVPPGFQDVPFMIHFSLLTRWVLWGARDTKPLQEVSTSVTHGHGCCGGGEGARTGKSNMARTLPYPLKQNFCLPLF